MPGTSWVLPSYASARWILQAIDFAAAHRRARAVPQFAQNDALLPQIVHASNVGPQMPTYLLMLGTEIVDQRLVVFKEFLRDHVASPDRQSIRRVATYQENPHPRQHRRGAAQSLRIVLTRS